ncbi:MAG: rhodoquinone biosynthesis methyltransferase RquA [Paludibacterium sp.]|uniref:rhodoquinone biosynthesis methyltransferase RquA n=1 Tax=Paludibacterium sp. TaxID=1917523 RepID=UPI0025CE89C3|nr:rhodoquinone biosynthesis methyltransferase RquA [Paludibacterium sp.]MBV8046073.1 rhodoquinone biosynthesis methyltransferase RquA [Paludibacterium sp.]MBV8646162.1 rhodoquinone biosynthesis methyltransferase RquA [Paludibacterium sp.]
MTRNPPQLDDDFYYRDVPDYMTEVYDWAYVNPRHAALLDRNVVVRVLLFGNDQRLMRAYLDRVRPGMRVWQVAHVYGDLVTRVARRVGVAGVFDLTDVTPVQIAHASRKLSGLPQARVVQTDAATFEGERDYDLVTSFFLLHEVPDAKKREVVDNMLRHVPPMGRALFVDYHRPAPWQPIGWLLRWVNRYLEPFAYALWRHDIRHYASDAAAFDWHKRTVFGGVYQIVEATPKALG